MKALLKLGLLAAVGIFLYFLYISRKGPYIIWVCGLVTLRMLLYSLVVFTTTCLAIYHKKTAWKCRPKIKLEPCGQLLRKTKKKLNQHKYVPKKSIKQKALVSRNVDDVIEEIIGLLLRDYVNSWYQHVVKQQSLFSSQLKVHIREMLFTFRNRCQSIDDVKFFTSDIVEIIHKHLQKVKSAEINPDKIQPYKVYSFLEEKDDELDYLRKIAEFFLTTLLPRNYARYKPLCHLLREILACTVFHNVVEKICDPDGINLRLISWLKSQQAAADKQNRPYAYAATYEDFIKMIQGCSSIEGLERWRYYINTEIMQATTMSKLKRLRGIDADKELNTQRTNKGDLLHSRNLPRYLNQLQFAKSLCDKRLKLLGPGLPPSSKGAVHSSLDEKLPVPYPRTLSMSEIMQSRDCRQQFSKFLQKEEKHSLIAFWEAVEEMKGAHKSLWHQLGNDIVHMYVHNQASAVHLTKNTLKGIEEFMMADKGPEAFTQAQTEVYDELEKKHYHSFIISDVYHKMMTEAETKGINFAEAYDEESYDDRDNASDQAFLESSASSEVSIFDHTSYARNQLKLTQEKLNDKIQAIKALRYNPSCDKKVTAKLDTEIQELCEEQKTLKNHIEKTELWIKYLGLWQATVEQATVTKENDKSIPYFTVLVHLSNEVGHTPTEAVGWVVTRNLSAFHILQQKLIPAAVWLKKIELPTKPLFKNLDERLLDKMKLTLQTFLSAVTKDDGLNKSEALYSFLSPSPEHMKHSSSAPKKPIKFNPFQFLVKGFQNTFGQFEDASEDELFFLDDSDCKEEDRKDSIAEPLYTLIGEIFELKGVFNWLRRTLIIFVQITYGKTINRQLRETVSYIVSEPMLLTYLQLFCDTMWPNNSQPKAPPSRRSSIDMFDTKCQAKHMLLDSIPDILIHLIGQQNARKGISKIFDALQDETMNKQLLYDIVEAFLHEYASDELKQSRKHSE